MSLLAASEFLLRCECNQENGRVRNCFSRNHHDVSRTLRCESPIDLVWGARVRSPTSTLPLNMILRGAHKIICAMGPESLAALLTTSNKAATNCFERYHYHFSSPSPLFFSFIPYRHLSRSIPACLMALVVRQCVGEGWKDIL